MSKPRTRGGVLVAYPCRADNILTYPKKSRNKGNTTKDLYSGKYSCPGFKRTTEGAETGCGEDQQVP